MPEAVTKLSCKRCQIRKLKCSRTVPCTNCVAASETCTKSGDDKRKKPISQRYVDALERQIASLEATLSRVRSLLSTEQIESLGIAESGGLLENFNAGSAAPEHPDTASDWCQFRRTPDGHLLFNGRTSIYRTEQRVQATRIHAMPTTGSQDATNLMSTLRQDSEIHAAIRLFFRWQYPNFMFVYREAFLLDYLSDAFAGMYCSPALVYGVCALGVKMAEDCDASANALRFRQLTYQMLFLKGFALPHITNIQALLCLAFAELGEGDTSRAWLLSGMAFRMCQDAGLQKEITEVSGSPGSDTDLEIRRRAYWGCYISDSIVSLLLGRPVFFDHEDASVNLSEPLPDMPFLVDWVQGDSPMFRTPSIVPYLRAASQLSRTTHDLIARICSAKDSVECRRRRIPSLQALDTRLCQWLDQLPEAVRWNQWHPSKSMLYPHVATLYITALSMRLCLYDEYTTLAPNDDFARSAKDVRDNLVDEICRLVLHFKTQHGLMFAPLIMVYAIAVCLHVIDKSSSHVAGGGSSRDELRGNILSKYLAECGSTYGIADSINAKIDCQEWANSHGQPPNHKADDTIGVPQFNLPPEEGLMGLDCLGSNEADRSGHSTMPLPTEYLEFTAVQPEPADYRFSFGENAALGNHFAPGAFDPLAAEWMNLPLNWTPDPMH